MQQKSLLKKISGKILVILIGIISFLILLEISLRIFGLFYQPKINKHISKIKADYTILTIGDSFTYGIGSTDGRNYPFQLEQFLNKKTNKKFKVINTGLNGQNSAQALEDLEYNISQYDPDMIILLIGGANYWNYYGYEKSLNYFTYRIRIFKLIKLLYKNIKEKSESNIVMPNKTISYNKDEVEIERKQFQDIMNKNKNYSVNYNNEGVFLIRIHEFDKAINWFNERILKDSNNFYNYEGKTFAYLSMRKYDEAIKCLKDAINSNKKEKQLYSLLGYVYSLKPDNNEAIKWLEEGIKIDNKYGILYFQIGKACFIENRINESKQWLKKGIELEPLCLDFYDYISEIEQNTSNLNKLSGNNTMFFSYNDTIDLKRFFYRLATPVEETGHINGFHKYLNNNTKLISEWVKSDVERIIKICKKNNVKIILQNYPINHFPPPDLPANYVLNDIASNSDIPFINNVELFCKLGEFQKSYFVPDGHCNNKGYGLMAKNLYNKIIEMKIFDIDNIEKK